MLHSIPHLLTMGSLPGRRSAGMVLAVALASATLATLPVGRAEARTYSAIVLSYPSGAVLHEENADALIYPASLTKMMTLYLTFRALDQGRLNLRQRLPISSHAQSQAPSKLGLRAGQTIQVEQAILALATKSANDIAVALAEIIAGSESAFAAEMTRAARALGMSRTTFYNASGLPHTGQLTTARDLSRLSQALLRQYGEYFHYFKRSQFHYQGRTYQNHNHLMERYPGMDGIKTGYIVASGFNLAASAVRNGHRLMAVVIGGRTARERDNRMADLLDQMFARIDSGKVVVAAAPVTPTPTPNVRRNQSPTPLAVVAANRGAGHGRPELFVLNSKDVPALAQTDDDGFDRPAAIAGAPAGAVQLASLPAVRRAGLTSTASDTEEAEETGSVDRSQQVPRPVVKPGTAPRSTAAARPAAAPPPAPAPAPGWGVDLGSFASKKDGQKALSRAERDAEAKVGSVNTELKAVTGRRGTVYRARLVGLSSNRIAERACQQVRKAGQTCQAVALN